MKQVLEHLVISGYSGELYFVEPFFAFGVLAGACRGGVFFGGGPVGFTDLANFLCLTFRVSITAFATITFVAKNFALDFFSGIPKATQLTSVNADTTSPWQ